MNNEKINKLLQEFKNLSLIEIEQFLSLLALQQPSDEKFIIETRFGSGLICPYCGAKGKGVSKKGKTAKGKQRFICQHCHKTFVATTNSVMYNSKKKFEVWKEYLHCFLNGDIIRVAAEKCGISEVTAFRWRHKICDSLQKIMNEVRMNGIIEADETYFKLSYMGNHSKDGFIMPRKAHKRGRGLFEVRKRGLSDEQICVPSVINRKGNSVARIAGVGKGSYVGISGVIGKHIEENSTICTDKASAYKRIAEDIGCELVQMKSEWATKGMYSTQRINNYHRRMKQFIGRFNGISSKHLNNYLVWYNFVWYAKENFAEKSRIILNHICSVNCYTKVREISKRPPIPYINDKVRRLPNDVETLINVA